MYLMAKGKSYKRDKRSPVPKTDGVSRIMSSIRSKDTKIETVFRKEIYKCGIRGYRVNYVKLPGKPDIVFLRKKIIIFIHGCFWHGCLICGRRIPKHNFEYWHAKIENNIARDKRNKQALEQMGYEVFEVWEHEIKNTLPEIIEKMVKVLKHIGSSISGHSTGTSTE